MKINLTNSLLILAIVGLLCNQYRISTLNHNVDVNITINQESTSWSARRSYLDGLRAKIPEWTHKTDEIPADIDTVFALASEFASKMECNSKHNRWRIESISFVALGFDQYFERPDSGKFGYIVTFEGRTMVPDKKIYAFSGVPPSCSILILTDGKIAAMNGPYCSDAENCIRQMGMQAPFQLQKDSTQSKSAR